MRVCLSQHRLKVGGNVPFWERLHYTLFRCTFQEKGKKMIIYNTTFHIHKDIVDECLEYLKNSYIPKASESGILYSPYLRRILDSRNEEGESFSVQFHTRDIDSLNEWVRKEGGALQQDLIGRYKEKIAGFSTLLEDIELPK